jgi:hypothetical protein
MSQIPAIVAEITRAANKAAETCGTSSGIDAMPHCQPPVTDRIPLSRRTSQELWARATELARMAATARTADARTALETLAARFAALAAKREAGEEQAVKGHSADNN